MCTQKHYQTLQRKEKRHNFLNTHTLTRSHLTLKCLKFETQECSTRKVAKEKGDRRHIVPSMHCQKSQGARRGEQPCFTFKLCHKKLNFKVESCKEQVKQRGHALRTQALLQNAKP
jgi:hypothetical protein